MIPATLRGPGWRPRSGTLATDEAWAAVGARDEWGPLRVVMLFEPPASVGAVEHPDDALFLRRPSLPRMRSQFEALAATYEAEGVRVVRVPTAPDAPPNVVFARDLFLATPEGAVVGRLAAAQRAGEERLATRALAQADVPIRLTVGGADTFEGADALWVGPGRLLVGLGRRTSEGAARQLEGLGVSVARVTVPAAVQHLLGAVAFVDADLALVHPAAGPDLRATLAALGVEALEATDAVERDEARAMNIVALGPRRVVMPTGAPKTRAALEARAVSVVEVDVSAYLDAAGGPGCVTGVVHRA